MISETDKSRLCVGVRQVSRALNEDKASRVYLASDCDEKISSPLIQLCAEKHAELFYVDTMSELGRMCGIAVKASCAAVKN